MKFFLLFYLLNSAYISAYQKTTDCESEFSIKQWRTFQNAKALMRELGIKTFNQFREWSRSEKRPDDFPSNPAKVYKEKWVNWGEFLGTGNVHRKIFRSYESAKALMKELGIKTFNQFREWSRSEQRPDDFPATPARVYKEKWVNWGEFLGTGNVHSKIFRSYESAKTLMKELDIKTYNQFQEWSRSEQRPDDFPSQPAIVYKEKWVNWREFLGTGNAHRKIFRSYKSAKALMKELDIKTQSQFKKWSRSEKRPDDFPSNPATVYKEKWVNLGEFLGTGNVQRKIFRSYESAKALMKELDIKTYNQFKEWSRSEKRPDDFPSNPATVYKEKWVNWKNFLDTERIFRSYESAKALMKELGIKTQFQFREWNRTGQRPDDFPSHPDKMHKEKWVNWAEFLDRQKPKKWMSYSEGKRYVQAIGIRTVKEFLKWLKSNERPEDFPPNPHIAWKKSWKSAQNFLKIQWVSFQKARAYIQLGDVTNKREYYELRELEDLRGKLPPNPATVYAPYWKSWDHFLENVELSDALAN